MKTAKVIFYDNALVSLDKEYQYKEKSKLLSEKLSNKNEDEIQDALNKLAFKIGVNIFGEDIKNKNEFVLSSAMVNDFNIGVWDVDNTYTGLDYLLKSYGLESVLECMSPALTLLDTKIEGYSVNWKLASIRIDKLLTSLKSKLNIEQPNEGDTHLNYYGVFPMPITHQQENQIRVDNSRDALTLTASERNVTKGNHINTFGYFLSTTPKQLHSIVHGVYKNTECVYVIYSQNLTWFVNQLEVIKETIDVISVFSPDKRTKAHLILID